MQIPLAEEKKLKILIGYPYFPSQVYPDVKKWTLEYIRILQEAGFDVEGFCLTLNPPGPRLCWRKLDVLWKRGDKTLLKMYEHLEEKLSGKDVFINQSGINLHHRFVEKLSVFTVFQCFDDPESSNELSRPAAFAYDLCLVGNIAELDSYRSWGAKFVEWTPMGLMPGIYDSALTYEQILNGERDIDLFMMIDRLTPWRKSRLDKLAEAFPDAHFYGRGWPRGCLSQNQVQFLLRAKIGPNLHNSTGPVNFRTFYLPANGVLQICDNKCHLGKIFELDKEVIGFDTVEECIDLCRYYLAHQKERRRIAAEGWRRATTDYTEVAVFSRAVKLMQKYMSQQQTKPMNHKIAVSQRKKTRLRRILYFLLFPLKLLRKIFMR